MESKGISNIFLTYANRLICEDPCNLSKIVNAIKAFISEETNIVPTYFEEVESGSNKVIKILKEFRTTEGFNSVKKVIEKQFGRAEFIFFSQSLFKYEYFNASCEHICPFRFGVHNGIDTGKYLRKNKKISCIECDQFYLLAILEAIPNAYDEMRKNTEHSNFALSVLNYFICNFVNTVMLKNLDDPLVYYAEEPQWPYQEPEKIFQWIFFQSDEMGNFNIRNYINGMIAYSLDKYSFRRRDKRRKEPDILRDFRRCGICNDFFVGHNINRRFCEKDECQKEYETQRQAKY